MLKNRAEYYGRYEYRKPNIQEKQLGFEEQYLQGGGEPHS